MDDPEKEIRGIVHRLTQGSPQQQAEAIDQYFTNDASFTHPFCRTSSFEGSRYLIHQIFQWYKLLSPRIELNVNSIAFDKQNLILYVTISQIFSIWFIPFHRNPVTLTTVLHLTQTPSSTTSPAKYHIKSQNDLYQVDQFFQFFAPWGIGTVIVYFWSFWATAMCVLGAKVGRPGTRWMQREWVRKREGRVNGKGRGTESASGNGGGRVNGVRHDKELAKEDYKKGYMDSKQVSEVMSIGTLQDRVTKDC